MFIVWPRTKPTNVRPACWARSTASEPEPRPPPAAGYPPAPPSASVRRGPAGNDQDRVLQRQAVFTKSPADDLVHGVVPTDVFPHTLEHRRCPSSPAACSPPVLIEAALLGAELVRRHSERRPAEWSPGSAAQRLRHGAPARWSWYRRFRRRWSSSTLPLEFQKWGHHVAGQPHIQHVVGIPSRPSTPQYRAPATSDGKRTTDSLESRP